MRKGCNGGEKREEEKTGGKNGKKKKKRRMKIVATMLLPAVKRRTLAPKYLCIPPTPVPNSWRLLQICNNYVWYCIDLFLF